MFGLAQKSGAMHIKFEFELSLQHAGLDSINEVNQLAAQRIIGSGLMVVVEFVAWIAISRLHYIRSLAISRLYYIRSLSVLG